LEEELTKGDLYRALVILLKIDKQERDTHLYGWGGGIEGSVSSVFETFKTVVVFILEHGTYFHITLYFVISPFPESYQSHESRNSFGSSEESPNHYRTMFWSFS
jgi:hypothetical protein